MWTQKRKSSLYIVIDKDIFKLGLISKWYKIIKDIGSSMFITFVFISQSANKLFFVFYLHLCDELIISNNRENVNMLSTLKWWFDT